ncbi:MAG TPA: DnaJ C-terminal domain-containing protein [Caulobacteraceae bacterium]|nr:DnaJ C-terminal domain-containing protein [Caulobacteraceae bacterium]
MAQDPYQELGVARSASADEIRRAFRKLAKQYHPDQNPNDKAAEERFKRISAAFDVIGDEDKRKKFDRGEIDADGHDSARGFRPGGAGARGGAGPGAGFGAEFEGVDLNSIFGEMFSHRTTSGNGFSSSFSGFSSSSSRGQDVRAQVEISIEDAVQGARRRIAFSDGRTIEVTIPKGAAEGQVLRLKGQGGAGRGGSGDALIDLSIAPHPVFRREGDGLVMDVPISLPDAVLGGKVEAPTPDGPVTLTVPKGSNSGAVLRLKGRGLPKAAGGKRGDLLARLMIVLPDVPDPQLEVFAEAWRRDRPYTPRRKS